MFYLFVYKSKNCHEGLVIGSYSTKKEAENNIHLIHHHKGYEFYIIKNMTSFIDNLF